MTGIALTVVAGAAGEPRGEPQPGEASRLVFDGDVVVIGRAASCDVCLPAPVVSARHAELRREEGDWYVTDLASTNGTRLNGEALPPRVPRLLRSGDGLGIAGFRITVELDVAVDAGTASATALVGRRIVRDVLARMRPEQAAPRLRVVTGPDAGRTITLGAAVLEVRIGRAEHCDLRLTDALASRDHAVVRRDVAGLALTPRPGAQPVFLNGESVLGERRLSDRDEIRLGNTRISVSDPIQGLLAEIEQLPDEAWRAAAEPPETPPAAPSPPSSRRLPWEALAIAAAVAAMGAAAYVMFLLARS